MGADFPLSKVLLYCLCGNLYEWFNSLDSEIKHAPYLPAFLLGSARTALYLTHWLPDFLSPADFEYFSKSFRHLCIELMNRFDLDCPVLVKEDE